MPLPKPSTNVDWTDGAAAKQVEPSAAKKLLGWVALERPPFEFMNFLFYNLDLWVKYLESVTDESIFSPIEAIVNETPGQGTHTNLQDAHDDAAVVSGSKIIITSDLTLASTVALTKQELEIEMLPGHRFKKDAGAGAGFNGILLNASADQCRLKNFSFDGSFSDGGDECLTIQGGNVDSILDQLYFESGNTSNLTDSGTDTRIISPLEK